MRTSRFRVWHRGLWYGAVWCLLQPVMGTAQSTDSLAPGARMRVTEVSAYQPVVHVGRLVAASRDSIWLAQGTRGNVAVFATPNLSRVEISTGRRRHPGKGLAFGAVAGAGLSGVVGGLGMEECCSSEDNWNTHTALVGGLIGAGVGLIVGVIVGSLIVSDQWQPVPDTRWRLGTRPGASRGLGMSWSF